MKRKNKIDGAPPFLFKPIYMNKNTYIYYFFDVLCGWCYGFSPVINQIHEKYKGQMQFEIFSGGMITGDRIGPIGEVAGYIKEAHKTVENTTGVKFGDDFLKDILEEGSTIFTSIPPALALVTFKMYQKENAIPFGGLLQKAVYYDGIDPNDYQAYGQYAAQYGIDPEAFVEKIQSSEATQLMEKEFQLTAQAGVQGFPTMVGAIGEEMFVITRGYAPFDKLDEVFQKIQKLAVAKS